MAHYALVNENNVVVQVITGRNEDEIVGGVSDWEAHYSEETGLRALRTSYNTSGGVHYNPETGEPSADQTKAIRYNYAAPGFTYDEANDAFVPARPYESWILNEDKMAYEAPTAMPEDGQPYAWNEATQTWDVIDA